MSLPIICYHKVGPVGINGRFLNVEAKTLESHVRYFKRRGFRFLTARELGYGGLPSRAVCLTFDDCYTTTIEYGFPVLEELDVRATFYAVTGLVGTASTWDGAQASSLCKWEALRILHRSGHEVGNHTQTHKALGDMDEDSQIRELKGAHEELLANGITAETACFPYGSMNVGTKHALDALGYKVGFALGKRLAEPTDDRRTLPRVVVAYSDKLPLFIYRLFIRPALRRKLA